MKLSTFKTQLQSGTPLQFTLPNQTIVPAHYHITEIGVVRKEYMDCGGTYRQEEKISFQLWLDQDYDHRLTHEKLLRIIEIGEQKMALPDAEIEVEFQGETIGKFHLDSDARGFQLLSTQTACLAQDACGIPAAKEKIRLSEITAPSACCSPESGCC